MTLKEFNQQYEKLKNHLNKMNYQVYTCIVVRHFLGRRAAMNYERFIAPHTNCGLLEEKGIFQIYLRILLIDSFYQECIKTKIYRKF
jgi:hypothetical protein